MASPVIKVERHNPFRGLEPYSEKDQLYGRDSDLLVLKDRVYSGRSTLLFSAPGAGKTSFLRAKAWREFEKRFFYCHVYDWGRWGINPYKSLLSNIRLAITPTPEPDESLCKLLSCLKKPDPRHPDGLLLVMDQFEELFQAHGYSEELQKLIKELCKLINDYTIPARVIISMRDDFLGSLSVFDNRIPSLFNNYYHLKSPTERQAREIILLTAREYNKEPDPAKLRILTAQLSRYSIGSRGKPEMPESGKAEEKTSEDESAEIEPLALRPIKDRVWIWLLRKARALKRLFLNPPPGPKPKIVKLDTVILPYLQIVCRELWERESKYPAAEFLAAWDDKKEPADRILRAICQQTLDSLGTERRKDLASRAFDYLMTQQGAKLPYERHILAEHMVVDADELNHVLRFLSTAQTNILREYRRPDGSLWVELYHDMYAVILQDWKRRREAQAARKRRDWFVRYVLAVGLTACFFFWYRDFVKYSSRIEVADEAPPLDSYNSLKRIPVFGLWADSELADFWERRAQWAALQEDAGRSLLYHLNALQLGDRDASRIQAYKLNSLLVGLKNTFRGTGGATISALAFSRNEKFLAIGTSDGIVEVWDIDSAQRLLLTKLNFCNEEYKALSSPATGDPIHELMFSADSTRVGARTAGGLAQTWGWGPNIEKCSDMWSGTSLLSFDTSWRAAMVAFPSGAIQEWTDKKGVWTINYPFADVRPKGKPGDKSAPQIGFSSVMYARKVDGHPSHIFAADTAGNVYVWKVGEQKPRPLVKGSGTPAVFSPDGRTMVLLSKGQFELWNLVRQGRITFLGTGSRTFPASYTPDGSSVLVPSADQIRVFSARTGNPEYSLPLGAEGETAQLVAPKAIWMTNQVQSPAIMAPDSGLVTKALPEPVSVAALSSQSRWLATTPGKEAVHLWDIQELARFDGTFRAVAASKNGLVVAMRNSNGNLLLRDTLSQRELDHANTDPRGLVALSPDARLLATLDKHVQLTVRSDGRQIYSHPLRGGQAQSILFSPDSQTLLVTYPGGAWEILRTSADLKVVTALPGSSAPTQQLEFTPDGKTLLVYHVGTLQIRRCSDSVVLGKDIPIASDVDPVFAFNPNATTLAVFTGTQIQTVNWQTGQLLESVEEQNAPSSMLFRPRARQLIGVFSDSLKWWDLNEKRLLLQQGENSTGYSNAYYWAGSKEPGAPSADYLLTVGQDGRLLQLRDPANGTKKGDGIKLGSAVAGVIWFTPDGSRAIVPTLSGWIHVFRADGDRLILERNEFMGGAPSVLVGPAANGKIPRVVSLVVVGATQRLSVVSVANDSGSELKGDLKSPADMAIRLGLDDEGRPRLR
jgi:WD40 repeat protein